jgi:hypothetical protein
MGAGGNTIRRISKFKKRITDQFKLQLHQMLYIDMSVILHAVNRIEPALALDMFQLEPESANVRKTVARYASCIVAKLKTLVDFDQLKQIELVFEGPCTVTSPSYQKRYTLRSGRLNKAVRAYWISQSCTSRSKSFKCIASNMGRPPVWFVKLLLNELEVNYGFLNVSLSLHESSDAYIMKSARLDPAHETVVMSVDTDFIALSPAGSIKQIIDPIAHMELSKDEVLLGLGMDANQLFLAYCLAGCDDIRTSIFGLGFVGATQMIMDNQLEITNTSSMKLLAQLIQSKFDTSISTTHDLINEIVSLYNQYNQSLPAPETSTKNHLDTSMLRSFLLETDACGNLRRPQLAAKFDMSSEICVKPILNYRICSRDVTDVYSQLTIKQRKVKYTKRHRIAVKRTLKHHKYIPFTADILKMVEQAEARENMINEGKGEECVVSGNDAAEGNMQVTEITRAEEIQGDSDESDSSIEEHADKVEKRKTVNSNRKSKKSKESIDKGRQKRKRSDMSKEHDELKRLHNVCSRNLGRLSKIVHPDLGEKFIDFLQVVLATEQQMENYMRIGANLKLRQFFAKAQDNVDVSLDALYEQIIGVKKGRVKLSDLVGELMKSTSAGSSDAENKIRDLITSTRQSFSQSFPKLENLKERSYNTRLNEMFGPGHLWNSQSLTEITGNFKTMAIRNFKRVLKLRVSRQLSCANRLVRRNLLMTISDAISIGVLGRKGIISGHERPTTDDQPDDEDIDEFADIEEIEDEIEDKGGKEDFDIRKVILRRVRSYVRKQKTRLTSEEDELVKSVTDENVYPDIQSFRKVFLPDYVLPLVNGWQKKLSENGYHNIGIALKLFADVNKAAFVQHLFPMPNLKGRMHTLTTTRLLVLFRVYDSCVDDTFKQSFLSPSLSDRNQLAYWQQEVQDKIWSAVFPFIDVFSEDKKLQFFLHSSKIDSDTMHCLFVNPRTSTAKRNGSGYNSRNWRCRLLDGESKINIDQLTGTHSEKDFKGMINLENAISKDEIHLSRNNASEFVTDRCIFAIDPGIVNAVGLIGALGRLDAAGRFTGEFVKKLISTDSYYQTTGVNDAVVSANQNGKELKLDMSKNHGRTMDPVAYENVRESYSSAITNCWMHDQNGREKRRQYQRLQSREQSFWAQLVNFIFAASKELHARKSTPTKTPVIIFGDGQFAAMKGKRSSNPTWLKQYLSRFFLVIILDEYNTSQICPKCQEKLNEISGTYRIKKCCNCVSVTSSGKTKNFLVNRDICAPFNFLIIAIVLLWCGKRPIAFEKTTKSEDRGEKSKCQIKAIKYDLLDLRKQ